MTLLRLQRICLTLALVCCGVLAAPRSGRAQNVSTPAPAMLSDRTPGESAGDIDIQLQLLIASNVAGATGESARVARLSPTLDGVVRQLRATLPFTSYRLGATLFHRVQNSGNLEVRGTGGIASLAPEMAATSPVFYEFFLRDVRLQPTGSQREIVRMPGFKFGLQVPIITGYNTNASAPVIQYQHTGINSGFSVPEGEPTVVGTFGVDKSGDLVVVVISAKKVTPR